MATLTTSFNIVVKTNAQKWDDIAQAVKDGTVTVGTTYPLKLNDGTTRTMRVIDVDPTTKDTVFADDSGYVGEYNADKSSNVNWSNSAVRTWLNGTYLNNLPSNLKNAIKQKTAVYYKEAARGSWTGYSNVTITSETITDTIWLPIPENIGSNYPNGYVNKQSGIRQYTYYNSMDKRKKSANWYLAAPTMWDARTTSAYSSQHYVATVTTAGVIAMNNSVGYRTDETTNLRVPHFILPGT